VNLIFGSNATNSLFITNFETTHYSRISPIA